MFRWAGSKAKLIPQLIKSLSLNGLERAYEYHEPFLGSGRLFFALAQQSRLPRRVLLQDTNYHLISLYKILMLGAEEQVLKIYDRHIEQYILTPKEYYLEIRSGLERRNPIEAAAQFLFLQQTSYAGIWRTSKKGNHNTPHGGLYSKPPHEAVREMARLLKKTKPEIDHSSYKITNDPDAVVYLDPPYGDSIKYTDTPFDFSEMLEQVRNSQCRWVLSYPENLVTKQMREEFSVWLIPIRRSVKTVTVNEAIITRRF